MKQAYLRKFLFWKWNYQCSGDKRFPFSVLLIFKMVGSLWSSSLRYFQIWERSPHTNMCTVSKHNTVDASRGVTARW